MVHGGDLCCCRGVLHDPVAGSYANGDPPRSIRDGWNVHSPPSPENEEKEATEEDKAMLGTDTKGNRSISTTNLIGISKSEIPETLVNLLAENKKDINVIIVVIEALAACSIYEPNSQKFSSMGVLKDLVLLL